MMTLREAAQDVYDQYQKAMRGDSNHTLYASIIAMGETLNETAPDITSDLPELDHNVKKGK